MKTERQGQHQFRALFWKNFHLQRRQAGTNLCQTFTPVICLMFVYLIKQLAFDKYQGLQFKFDFPFLFNVPALYNAYPTLLNLTCLQWYNYAFSDAMTPEERHFVGWNTGIPGKNMSHGLLSHVVGKPGCMYEQNNSKSLITVPYFKQPKDSINEDIYQQVLYLNTVPFKRGADMQELYLIPDGGITFNKASEKGLNMTIQVNDIRLHEYHRSNGVTKIRYRNYVNPEKTVQMLFVAEGQLSILDLVSRAYLNYLNPDVWLISGVQYMPIIGDDVSFILKAINVTGACLYPFALALLLPVFLYAIVLEKEERLLQMMKMNGMRMYDYWMMTFIFNALMTALTFGLFFLIGYFVVDLTFFTQTNKILLILLFVGWGLSQISLAFFFQVFINKARIATIIGYVLSIWISVMSVTINMVVFPDPYEIPVYLQMVPPIAFARLIYVLSMQCSQTACIQDAWPLSQEITGCLVSLYLGFIVFGALGLYLHEIVPQEYGVSKSCNIGNKKRDTMIKEFSNEQVNVAINEAEEDNDSKQERQSVYETLHSDIEKYPLFCRDLCKVYEEQGGRPENVAVKSMCLRVEQGEIFGLLGPNGAGKTTLISMLTGLYPSTHGNAWVGGHDIRGELSKVQMSLGVCPQFDLLWPELTVEEHLLFYARLKGVPKELERTRVQQSMKEVKLTPFFQQKAVHLSGGMKRRLSIAIALVGDPPIVFLDEPSTGLDPENRRQLWDILVECRGRRAMVLTTHSMEEADVLCNRIGIISQGVLRCIGPQVRLKSLYGGGYHLYISCHKDRFLHGKDASERPATFYYQKVIDYVQNLLPQAELVQSFNGNFTFQIAQQGITISRIFSQIESQKEELRIADWGISQSSLEDVFMKIVENP